MSKKTVIDMTPREPLWINATGVILRKGALSDKPVISGTKPTSIRVSNIIAVEQDSEFSHNGSPLTVVLFAGSSIRVIEPPEYFGCPSQPAGAGINQEEVPTND